MNFFRRFSSTVKDFSFKAGQPLPPLSEIMLKEDLQTRAGAKDSIRLWKNINLFLVIPALVVVAAYTLPQELEHIKHLEEHPNKLKEYSYLRKRKNPFPWGDDSLFHNENSNPRPE